MNYDVAYENGTLYVIPNRLTAKAITPTLVCVEELHKDPSGFRYKAHFEYTNDNYAAVYITNGADNKLISAGSYAGQPPQLFPKGTGQFEILFDGSPLTWSVSSYFFAQKKTSTAVASSDSPRCQEDLSLARSASESLNYNLADELGETTVAYPNPTIDYVNISISGLNEQPPLANIMIIDGIGKMYPVKARWNKTDSILEVDLSDLNDGLYLIKVTAPKGNHVVKVYKE
jgi:hypothetical protein